MTAIDGGSLANCVEPLRLDSAVVRHRKLDINNRIVKCDVEACKQGAFIRAFAKLNHVKTLDRLN
jgi:hypothetical protein